MTQASTSQINEFVRVVDEFMAKHARMISPETQAAVYASGNAQLIADYNSAVTRGNALKATIELTVGAWNSAKAALQKASDTSSMYIGDAIDWLRSQFGYEPSGGANGLGALQIPAAVWVAGIVAAAYALNKLYTTLFIAIEASKLQRENPGMPRATALEQAKNAIDTGGFFGNLALPLGLLAVAALAFLAMR